MTTVAKKRLIKTEFTPIQNSSLLFYVIQDVCCLYAVIVVIIALVI